MLTEVFNELDYFLSELFSVILYKFSLTLKAYITHLVQCPCWYLCCCLHHQPAGQWHYLEIQHFS